MANLGEAKHWIGGEWSTAGAKRESINPATGEVIGHYADGNAENRSGRDQRRADCLRNRPLAR